MKIRFFQIPRLFAGVDDPEKKKKIEAPLEYLDQFLDGENYVAGKNMTIADIVLLVSVSNLEVSNYIIYWCFKKWYILK